MGAHWNACAAQGTGHGSAKAEAEAEVEAQAQAQAARPASIIRPECALDNSASAAPLPFQLTSSSSRPKDGPNVEHTLTGLEDYSGRPHRMI